MTCYDSILFDLDGTLIDSSPGIACCVRHALGQMGFDVECAQPLDRFIGPSLIECFTRFCGFDPETARRAVRLYRERYAEVGLFEIEVYPGIPELVRQLHGRGHRLILATLKPEPYAKRILDRIGLADCFEGLVGSHLDGRRNTKSEIVADAIAAAGDVPRQRIVMVGDHPYDILSARQHGIDAIAVAYGFGADEELAEAAPTALAESVADLGALLGVDSPRPFTRQGEGRPC